MIGLYRIALAAFAGLTVLAGGLSATPVVFCKDGVHSGNPAIDLVSVGCISGDSPAYGGSDGFYDNSGGGDSEADVEQAIFHATGVPVDIEPYDKSGEGACLTHFDGSCDNPGGVQSGTWDVIDPSVMIAYITIKAADSFALYEISPQANSGPFTTSGMFNKGGKQPNVSHITLWLANDFGDEAEVPEPLMPLLLSAGFTTLAVCRRWRRFRRNQQA